MTGLPCAMRRRSSAVPRVGSGARGAAPSRLRQMAATATGRVAARSASVWPRTHKMPRPPSLWLSTVSAATSPARPLSTGKDRGLFGGERRLRLAREAGGGDRLLEALDFLRRQFDERRTHDRGGQPAEQMQHLLHAVVHVEEGRRVESLDN